MKVELNIKTIVITENTDEDYKMISFGDNEIEENITNYVLIQRANNFDEQDKKLGMDNYYFEYNDQSNSGYGICEKITLDMNVLNFKFPKSEKNKIINIILTLDEQKFQYEVLIKYLRNILSNSLEIKNPDRSDMSQE